MSKDNLMIQNQVVSKLKNLIPKRSDMLNIMEKQGFDLNLK